MTHTFTLVGVYEVTVTATDGAGRSTTSKQTVTANAASRPDNRYCKADGTWVGTSRSDPFAHDGPADLPQRCILTAPWNMPSPGAVIPVNAGEDLVAAYNSATCGQTLKLAHGATWKLPMAFAAKHCDNDHWITITSDGNLPKPGTRVKPSDAPQMAKFATTDSNGAASFGDHIHLIGIEWAKTPGPKIVRVLANLKHADHVVFERSYFHGNPKEELQHGIQINTGKYIAVIDSYFEEFHCIALTGSCTEAQAISGGAGSAGDLVSQSGPVKIVNNFLSASTQSILFGGGAADGCGPNDIEIRRNYMFKPQTWNPNDPDYIGTAYIAKNILEFKNGCRALIEGNVLEGSWGGFTQRGYAVLLTPKNQSGLNGTTLCPNCAVTDITMRYNYISTAAGAFSIGSGVSDNGGWSQGQHRTSIHDNIAENLQYPTCYQCGRMLFELGSGYNADNPPQASAVLSDVSISNLTLIARVQAGSALLNIGAVPSGVAIPQASSISFRNSIVATGQFGMYSTGGGSNNCTYFAEKPATPRTQWEACFAGDSEFTGNVLVGYPGQAADWPTGNFLAPDWEAVQFADYEDGLEGDYHLSASSPYKNPDPELKDPGADIDKVNEMIEGAR